MQSNISQKMEEHKSFLLKYNLDINEVVKVDFRLNLIEDKIKSLTKQRSEIVESLDGDDNLYDKKKKKEEEKKAKENELNGLHLSREEAYMHEGRTGAATINIVYQRQYGKDATPEMIESIYAEKSEEFNRHPEPERMSGAWEVLQKIKAEGLTPVLVTGSGQHSLLDRLAHNFPGMFQRERMVTAFDVKYGKPNPEPYLMGLEKAGVKANEAIVVENAPIGVQAGAAAGIFTIAVNTGPLDGQVLLDAGANLLFPSMQAFCDNWEAVRDALASEK